MYIHVVQSSVAMVIISGSSGELHVDFRYRIEKLHVSSIHVIIDFGIIMCQAA